MSLERVREYRDTLTELLRESDRKDRRDFLASQRGDIQYKEARLAYRDYQAREGILFVYRKNRLDEVKKNKVIEVKKTKPLSEKEKVVLWSESKFAEYKSLRSGKTYKFFRDIAAYLAEKNEYLGEIVDVWDNYKPDVGDENKWGEFSNNLCDIGHKYVKGKWNEIGNDSLGNMIRVLPEDSNSNGGLKKKLITSLLSGFFDGPDEKKDIVTAYLRYTGVALDLLYESAFVNAVKIGTFRNNEILSTKSNFYRQLVVILDTCINNDNLLQRAWVADRIMENLRVLVVEQFKAYPKEIEDSLQNTDDKDLKKFVLSEARKAIKTERDREKIIALQKARYSSFEELKTDEQIKKFYKRWPYYLISGYEGKIATKYEHELDGLMDAIYYKKYRYDPEYEKDRRGRSAMLSFPIKNERMVDVFIPENDRGIKYIILKDLLAENSLNELGGMSTDSYLVTGLKQIDNKKIYYHMRDKCDYERKNNSEIRVIENIGLPEIKDENLISQNKQNASDILANQSKFLPSRRLRVPITNSMMKAMGYDYLEVFAKKNTGDYKMSFGFSGVSYSFLVKGQTLEIDTGARAYDNLDFLETLRYVALSYLRPLLVSSDIEAKSDEGLRGSSGVVKRIAHFRELPAEHRPSKDQISLYRQTTGKTDFDDQVARLKNSKQTDNNFTFVRAVDIDEGENLPPIECSVPQDNILR